MNEKRMIFSLLSGFLGAFLMIALILFSFKNNSHLEGYSTLTQSDLENTFTSLQEGKEIPPFLRKVIAKQEEKEKYLLEPVIKDNDVSKGLIFEVYDFSNLDEYKRSHSASLAYIENKKGIPTIEDLNYIGKIYGLPDNLLYAIMMKESLGHIYAVSHKNAKGAFQFIDETAKEFGLIEDGVDYRVNPWRSADAAARYIKWLFLYLNPEANPESYDSYKYSLAAYNAGISRVKRGNVVYIPNIKETKDYVEKILGFVNGYKHFVQKGETLAKIAREHKTTRSKIKHLNYGLSDATLRYGTFINIAKPSYGENSYIVKSGDTLNKISSLTGIDLYTIKEENKIKGDMIYVGQKLYIPKRG